MCSQGAPCKFPWASIIPSHMKAVIHQSYPMCTRKACLESNFISNSINSQVAPFIILHKSILRPNSPWNVSFNLLQSCLKSLHHLKQFCGLCIWGGREGPRRGEGREEETPQQHHCPARLCSHGQNIWMKSKNQVNSGPILNWARCLFYSHLKCLLENKKL